MSNTIITLLKIVLHGDIHIDEIAKYINLDSNSIDRNIHLLNDYLKEKGLKQVVRHHNIYSLEYSTGEIRDFFSQLDILSSKERRDIFCIRFLLYGYINLEKERQRIGVSRTTAIKDFKKVKEELEENGIQIESKNSKGIFLIEKDNEDIRIILCEKILKLYLERDFLSVQRKELFDELNTIDEEYFMNIYRETIEEMDGQASVFSFYSICSMAVVEKFKEKNIRYEKFIKKIPSKGLKEINDKLKEKNYDRISKYFLEFISGIFYKVKNYHTYDLLKSKTFDEFYKEIKTTFGIQDDISEKLYKNLKIYFIRGLIKKRYGFFSVRKTPDSKNINIIIEKVSEILKRLDIEMIYSDEIGVAECLIEFFLEEELQKQLKVIAFVKDYSIEYVKKTLKCFLQCHPNLEMKVEPYLYYKFMDREELRTYGLILSDTEILTTLNFKRVDMFNICELENLLEEFALEKRVEILSL